MKLVFRTRLLIDNQVAVEAGRYMVASAVAQELGLELQRSLSPDGNEQLLIMVGSPEQIASAVRAFIGAGFVKFAVLGATKEETDMVCAQANQAMASSLQFFTENPPPAVEPAPQPAEPPTDAPAAQPEK